MITETEIYHGALHLIANDEDATPKSKQIAANALKEGSKISAILFHLDNWKNNFPTLTIAEYEKERGYKMVSEYFKLSGDSMPPAATRPPINDEGLLGGDDEL